MKLYRSGPVFVPSKRGVEALSYAHADLFLPEGRQGRTTAIFAVSEPASVIRWVRGNKLSGLDDVKVREFDVNPDGIFVYDILKWQRASNSDNSETLNPSSTEKYKNYWDSGVSLSEHVRKTNIEPSLEHWEILVPEKAISNVRVIPFNELKKYMDDIFKKEILGYYK